jgi:predicted enzyme related to lactoylglutathione lyase
VRSKAAWEGHWCPGSLGVDVLLADDVSVRIEFTLDCSNLDRMTTFWREAAGFVVDGVIEDRYVSLGGHRVTLTLQRVDELKTVKNRMHIDLLVDDLDAEVHRLEGLGALRLTPKPHEEFGQTWFVLADPEGNEFCVAKDRESSHPSGAITWTDRR